MVTYVKSLYDAACQKIITIDLRLTELLKKIKSDTVFSDTACMV